MMRASAVAERPPMEMQPGGGGGDGDGPDDQTPMPPAHPGEVGTGLYLVRGRSGVAQKHLVRNITHAQLLSLARQGGAFAVKWITPRLAAPERVESDSDECERKAERCVDTCVDVGCVCDRQRGLCH